MGQYRTTGLGQACKIFSKSSPGEHVFVADNAIGAMPGHLQINYLYNASFMRLNGRRGQKF
jgi:hypothetical protein